MKELGRVFLIHVTSLDIINPTQQLYFLVLHCISMALFWVKIVLLCLYHQLIIIYSTPFGVGPFEIVAERGGGGMVTDW